MYGRNHGTGAFQGGWNPPADYLAEEEARIQAIEAQGMRCVVCDSVCDRETDTGGRCRWCVTDELTSHEEWVAIQRARHITGDVGRLVPASSPSVEVPGE